MSFSHYLFIWDNYAQEVVASYYIERPGAGPQDGPGDVSHGAIPAHAEEARIDALREDYPLDRYTFGGGYSSSLDHCVESFFGMEKDYSHFFEEPMGRVEAAAIAHRHINQGYQLPGDELVVLTDSATPKPYGWVFFCQSRAFLATGDENLMLVGVGPLVVRQDGTVHTLGSARPPEEEVAAFEADHGLAGGAA
jgi:hypothetical protein